MNKRILISTRNGFKLYGDYYESDDSSSKLDLSSNHTEQDTKEFVKAVNKYRINANELDCWKVQILP